MCCKTPGFNASVGGSLFQAQPALSPQDGDVRANKGGLLPHFGLADVEAYRLWEAPISRRPCMALLWDLWPSYWPHSREETGVGRVSFPVLFQKWAGPTKEQGKDNDRGGAQFTQEWNTTSVSQINVLYHVWLFHEGVQLIVVNVVVLFIPVVCGHTAVPPLPLYPAAEPCVSAHLSDWWRVAQSSHSLSLSIRPRGQD